MKEVRVVHEEAEKRETTGEVVNRPIKSAAGIDEFLFRITPGIDQRGS